MVSLYVYALLSLLQVALDAVKNLKRGKHDGNSGYFSDHIIRAPNGFSNSI